MKHEVITVVVSCFIVLKPARWYLMAQTDFAMNGTQDTSQELTEFSHPLGSVSLSLSEKLCQIDLHLFSESITSRVGQPWLYHACVNLPDGDKRLPIIFLADLNHIAVTIGFLSEHIFKHVPRSHVTRRCVRYNDAGLLIPIKDSQINTKIKEIGDISRHPLYVEMLRILRS